MGVPCEPADHPDQVAQSGALTVCRHSVSSHRAFGLHPRWNCNGMNVTMSERHHGAKNSTALKLLQPRQLQWISPRLPAVLCASAPFSSRCVKPLRFLFLLPQALPVPAGCRRAFRISISPLSVPAFILTPAGMVTTKLARARWRFQPSRERFRRWRQPRSMSHSSSSLYAAQTTSPSALFCTMKPM